jgi:hypothetical protein
MPSNDRFRRHDDEAPLPAGPELASSDPKQSIDKAELSPRMSALQDCQLLAKSQVFQQ